MKFQREMAKTLLARLEEAPSQIHIIAGPRQVGKTTLVKDVLSNYSSGSYLFIAVDQPDFQFRPELSEATTIEEISATRDVRWLVRQWEQARRVVTATGKKFILVFDEIQKVSKWSEAIKGLWDADRAAGLNLHVVLLGSSPLLMQKGLTESLAGRYELIRASHWSFLEMYQAFDFDLDDYIFYGGYPGAAKFIQDEARWKSYIRDGLVFPSIEKDVLMMSRVDKPALLKQVFAVACQYSGQEISYTKLLGQLQDAGNTVTLAHYLDLLSQAGLVGALQKYAGQVHRSRASTPKFVAYNTALVTYEANYTHAEAKADRAYWGHLVESAVGAHLYNTGHPRVHLYYWRDNNFEVDFILEKGNSRTIIEVKSSKRKERISGFDEFEKKFGPSRKLLVGENGIPVAEFLSYEAEHWL